MGDLLNKAADDMRDLSEELGIFELGVFHMQQKNNDNNEFLLVGVNESNEEAVKIFEKWESRWREDIRRESTEIMDEIQNVAVHEYRKI